jgi:predicted RNase H-like HicB family nuclease
MSKYAVCIYWSKDDQAFIAEVPELAGCAADGATYQEALANVETVIREWIETAKVLGRPFLNQRAVWRSLDLAHR